MTWSFKRLIFNILQIQDAHIYPEFSSFYSAQQSLKSLSCLFIIPILFIYDLYYSAVIYILIMKFQSHPGLWNQGSGTSFPQLPSSQQV